MIAVPPLSIKILRQNRPLIVGKSRTVECEVTGARPVPNITWWKGGTHLQNSQLKVEKLKVFPTLI